jgi:hypothetical protein
MSKTKTWPRLIKKPGNGQKNMQILTDNIVIGREALTKPEVLFVRLLSADRRPGAELSITSALIRLGFTGTVLWPGRQSPPIAFGDSLAFCSPFVFSTVNRVLSFCKLFLIT